MPTPTSQSTPRLHVTDEHTTNGAVPKLSGDIRPLIPTLGLRNYWYPALADRKVGWRKPVKVSMLGEEICLFRGAQGDVVAVQDVCPHRGARLSEGDCHYRGTVACPYHGWVYDESGKNVMVLSEGPGSGVCGKAGTEAKAYPTRTLKGLVFVWIGEGAPAPMEEDVPEEFFDEETLVLVGQVEWRCNWEVALENSMDSHVNYVRQNPLQDLYPDGRKWPKTTYRRLWTWLTRPLAERARRHIPPPRSARWCGGHHLPGMFRAEFGWDLYTRMCVPVEEHRTRVWYYHCTRPKSAIGRLWERVTYAVLHRWIIEYNFSRQDERVMINQRYDTPEKLSSTDAEVIQWRRLVVTRHFGGRDAPFEYKNPDGLAPDSVPLSRVSVRYLQEQMRTRSAGAALPPTIG